MSDVKLLPKRIDQDEHHYVTVNDVPTFRDDEKINELLVRVKRMEGVLVKISNSMAAKPNIPPKPANDNTGNTGFPNLSTGPLQHADSPVPPPRPPRSPIANFNKKKMFNQADCEFLQAQLLCVRGYFDSMIDDDYDDKREHMMALDSVISALKFR